MSLVNAFLPNVSDIPTGHISGDRCNGLNLGQDFDDRANAVALRQSSK
jgi:hypothetical protein